MSAENQVRSASKQFYAALNAMLNGDGSQMAAAWSNGPAATSMHPVGGRQVGWAAVGDSFEQFAQMATGGFVTLDDQLIHVLGDVACELGIERGEVELSGHRAAIEHRVTNVYQRQDDVWKLVHHHTDTSAAMLDLLSRL